MKKVLLVLLLIGSPALAQTQLVPRDTVKPAAKGAAARVADVCAPIGKTAKGELVYSMKCNDMPAPPAPPSQAEAAPAAADPRSEPEVRRSGVFGWSYDRRKEAE
jgi:hypothetical protein